MHAHPKPVHPLSTVAAQFVATCNRMPVAWGTYSHNAVLLLDSVDAQRTDRMADAAEVLVDMRIDLLGLCAVKLMQQLLLVVVGKQGLRLATVGS